MPPIALKSRRNWRRLFFAFVLVGVAVFGLTAGYRAVKKDLSGYHDTLYLGDYSWSCYEIGTALRLSRAGFFGGKPRHFVIVVRNAKGQVLETLYDGPGGYPDAPKRPSFIVVAGDRVTYHVEIDGHKDFSVPLLSRKDCGGGKKEGGPGP